MSTVLEDIAALQAREADTEFLVRKSMTKGYQLFSALVPPAYTGFVLLRRPRGHFSINRLLRATWVGGGVGASLFLSQNWIATGGAYGYARSVSSSPDALRMRRLRAAYDADSLRADDHATIGALLFAVLTPAVLWKRATTIHLILGGAGLGAAVGLTTHTVRHITGDPAPPTPLPEIIKRRDS
ncbi:hypothetical protein K488DRAFT_51237 [Vararia minispora EC-137]|uniref:Uncharacterized protein n=1 Tax=Vararia minispora EC-137 TaxID=1314806 RepID=A0ACB8QJF1_9AGAM|nr:hypothetical protein K488DRAFT_51237 [Vararia minispora EC-137]